MTERREIVTICRHIGGMMEAGVDILRITRVLRAQTKNARLLEFYDHLDHDLTMGRSIADALESAPDLFSPFAVSLIQQGEERNDLSGAFLKLADYLQQEGAGGERFESQEFDGQDKTIASPANISTTPHARQAQGARGFDAATLELTLSRLRRSARAALYWLAALLAAWTLLLCAARAGMLAARWLDVWLLGVAVIWCALAALSLRESSSETPRAVDDGRQSTLSVAQTQNVESPRQSTLSVPPAQSTLSAARTEENYE